MPTQIRIVSPGPHDRTVVTNDGKVLDVPDGWVLLRPGDAGLTRRVKAAGPTWTVQERKGRKVFTRGVWAPEDRIKSIQRELEAERATPAYAKKQASAASRRQKEQAEYVVSFQQAVKDFLNFAPCHQNLADRLANAVAAHATPVGSGTVARTEMIPIEKRAEAAVIAWLRHQTTEYDSMRIARRRGLRREVRQMLAAESRVLLKSYRQGEAIDSETCPLHRALNGTIDPLEELELDDDRWSFEE